MMTGQAYSDHDGTLSIPPGETETANQGASTPELVPVVDVSAPAAALPQPAGAAAGDIALGDILSDTLFGEVIDISDLIPALSAEAAIPGLPEPTGAVGPGGIGLPDGGEFPATTHLDAGLSILYDEDILASDGTIL
jgi:hypothetical protein